MDDERYADNQVVLCQVPMLPNTEAVHENTGQCICHVDPGPMLLLLLLELEE